MAKCFWPKARFLSWINSWYLWILWLFFAMECCQRKVDSCWKGVGGAFLKMSPLAWERLFDSTATLMGRDSSNAHVKPSARQRGASVTRMEFDATPVAIRIGSVTIMIMISWAVVTLTICVMASCRSAISLSTNPPRKNKWVRMIISWKHVFFLEWTVVERINLFLPGSQK